CITTRKIQKSYYFPNFLFCSGVWTNSKEKTVLYLSRTKSSRTVWCVSTFRKSRFRCHKLYAVRVCTGRCLPGYVFDDEVYSDEMTLECRGGYWRPRQYFPPCKSQGHCNLRVIGAGFFNCTTGMDGTRCDVNCDGVHQGRYHCYPGRGWNPSLPYCAVPKHGESNRRPCRCENGGICDDNGKCRCPRGRTGTYCER
ncbi:CUB and sushi domain-containing protein 3, partial [Trichonephila clavata]